MDPRKTASPDARREDGATKVSRSLLAVLALACTCALPGCSSDDDAAQSRNVIPPSVERTVQALTRDLAAQGMQVSRGYFRLYTQEDCEYSFASMMNCYGNNPAAPYIGFALRPWPEEFQDPATTTALGLVDEGYRGTFRLDPREALVILGVMPPPGAYFGLQTYLFTREGTYDKSSSTYQYIATNAPATLSTYFAEVPGNLKRIQVFGSLGNSNNDVVFERQSGGSFGQERYFIVTPDKTMDGTVRNSLQKLSVSAAAIVTEPVPTTTRLGLGESADEFVSVMRYAMPADGGGTGTASDTWREQLPMVVLRVRDPRQGRATQPYPPSVLDAREAIDESPYAANLAQLVAAVSARWGIACTGGSCPNASSFQDLQLPPYSLVGPICTQIGMNCLGDTQDTTYDASVALPLSKGEVYAVAGTLATETGNATYAALSVNDTVMKKGLANIDSDLLKNTARGYAANVGNAEKLYLYYFTRDCSTIGAMTGGNCFSVDTTMIPDCPVYGSPSCDYLKIGQRRYVEPCTMRGPDSLKTLGPMTIRVR